MQARSKCGFFLAGALTLFGFAHGASADDRDLLKGGNANPYVFVVLDTSGSMNWSAPCSNADYAAGVCGFPCPSGDCFVPRNADDPNSKFRQAKEALAEVISKVTTVNFGFATYNQDHPAALTKHWLYKVSATQPVGFAPIAIPGPSTWTQYPQAGAEEVFGSTISCTTASNTGCVVGRPAVLSASGTSLPSPAGAPSWGLERVRRLPKGDAATRPPVVYYIQENALPSNKVFRVTYQLLSSQVLGNSTVQASVAVDRCTPDCSTGGKTTALTNSPQTMNFDVVADFLMWDNGASTGPAAKGYFTQGQADTTLTNTCAGWDPNTDNATDAYTDAGGRSYDLKQDPTTVTNTTWSPFMDYGDVIPLDWANDNRAKLLKRLAPDGTSAFVGESFAQADYFNDLRTSPQQFLTAKDNTQKPLFAGGSTPLGHTLGDWRTWYTGSDHGQANGGWRQLAIANDPQWGCRKVYLLVITDGDDTCPGRDPCSDTAALNALFDTKTYVVGFGVQNSSGNRLTCMAANGGTGNPILPQNKQQLVAVLTDIFSKVKEDAAAFASAAVPSVQAQVADKVYLTNFTPLNKDDPTLPAVNIPTNASAIWNGHIEAYLKPLPVDVNGVVNKTPCIAGQTSRCLAWDAAEAMLPQSPTAAEIATNIRKIGPGVNERRVYYSNGGGGSTVPMPRQSFVPPTVTADKYDLWNGMGIAFTPGNTPSETAAGTASTTVIDFTLERKHSQITRSGSTVPVDVDYILGDIFHSNPVVLNNPSNFRYFMSDLEGKRNADTSGIPPSCTDITKINRGYRCFFDKQRCRRRMLFVGSDDGQLHAFDSGIFAIPDPKNTNRLECNDLTKLDTSLPEPIGSFNNGTGQELFSFIPREALPKLKQYSDTGSQDWSVDGTPVPDDVFIDPTHNGSPTDSEREWRTVMVTGMREGGNAYFALDITQPDTYDSKQVSQPSPAGSYVPSCANGTASTCGANNFPTELWEFKDRTDEDTAGLGLNHPDLGQTWSIPNIGRIRVCDGTDCSPSSPTNKLVDKYVAIFGGGLEHGDAAKPYFAQSGNWLYMMDIETGTILYKRQLAGAAPSEPAAVDTNQDGYIDTVYIGTTAGYMEKVDMSTVPQLETYDVTYHNCPTDPCSATNSTKTVKRIRDTAWEPFKIFDTVDALGVRRPIFFPPAVIFVAKLGRYALGFGTGNREDLWRKDSVAGRFYMIADTGFVRSMALSGALPRTEAQYDTVDPEFTNQGFADHDFILNPNSNRFSGWVMPLKADERVIANTFSLSGITVFTGFTPTSGTSTTGNGNNATTVCTRGGDSRIFTVLSTTADPVQNAGGWTRYVQKDNFVTNPFTEQAQTKNSSASDQTGQQLTADQQTLFEKLKTLFPSNCRFSNFRIDIKTVRADTKLVLIAPVPICIIEKNWKEY
ncbi:MAG: hypothetical protein ABI632_04505 [Pseudolysinimonas sp.]